MPLAKVLQIGMSGLGLRGLRIYVGLGFRGFMVEFLGLWF